MAKKKEAKGEQTVKDEKKVEERPEEKAPGDGAPKTKATIKDGVYRIGDVQFGVSDVSLIDTDHAVRRQPRIVHEAIVLAHEWPIESKSAEQITMLARSLVQQDWYLALKGEVPASTLYNHERRVQMYQKAKAVEAPAPHSKSAHKEKSEGGTPMAKTKTTKGGGERKEFMGASVTAVLRWMGKNGFTWQQAAHVLKAKKVESAEATVKIQVRAGEKGERGEPATLTREQQAELRQLRDEFDEKEKAAEKKAEAKAKTGNGNGKKTKAA